MKKNEKGVLLKNKKKKEENHETPAFICPLFVNYLNFNNTLYMMNNKSMYTWHLHL